ncbi:MAG TPA: DUF5985 family protein [Blastocatellia bacterium]|nr:DUF5985 family protein [Blastocatellia bacterium]
MKQFLLGANAIAALIVGLFFLRFWRDTHDRFFLFFAAAFGIEAINRFAQSLSAFSQETEPIFYVVRLISFLLIFAAIVNKNRSKRVSGKKE